MEEKKNNNEENEKDFILYEKKEKRVANKDADFYVDYFACFGWELYSSDKIDPNNRVLLFRRLRKLKNKEKLNEKQREVEKLVYQKRKLQIKKDDLPMILAIWYGLLSSAILGVGLALALNSGGSNVKIVFGIIIAVVGFLMVGMNYPMYLILRTNLVRANTPAIEELDDKIAEGCQEAEKILRS
ncbi:MAG: inorganic phosphate transporter [Bacilli bacterium]|jgi:hypothetical protein|nr:inorganic phosphate transporter [Bacilli bacterium]